MPSLMENHRVLLELEMRNVVLEDNAQTVVNAVKNEEIDWSWYGSLIEDLKYVIHNQQHWSTFFCS